MWFLNLLNLLILFANMALTILVGVRLECCRSGGNMTANQLAFWRLQEEKRSNLARESETERSNREQEEIKQTKNIIDAAKNTSDAINNVLKLFKPKF